MESAALIAGADILLYSCFTALGVTGEQLITSLAQYDGSRCCGIDGFNW